MKIYILTQILRDVVFCMISLFFEGCVDCFSDRKLKEESLAQLQQRLKRCEKSEQVPPSKSANFFRIEKMLEYIFYRCWNPR